MIMKTQQLLLSLLMLVGVGCSPTPHAENQQNETPEILESDSVNNGFVWPDSLGLSRPNEPAECYLDPTLRAYSADTALFAEEEQFIEDQLAFVAHYASTITLPKAWSNHPILSQMVEYYNFMSFAHAIETDLDAYYRYEDEVEEGETDSLLMALKEEYGRLHLNDLKKKQTRTKINDIIQWALSDEDARQAMDTLPDSPTDITLVNALLTDSWMDEMPDDSLELERIYCQAMPQGYLPDWVPDIYVHFVGQESQPTETDQEEVYKRFMAAESFDEKAAWGYVAMGMQMPFEMSEAVIREVEVMLSSGCYSPLLDPLWRAYRTQYNNLHSCPSTFCYSPNLRYNHFRRMIAYVTMRHIEAYPEDLQARLQYYNMVTHADIIRFNPYPYGNSSAYEFVNLYWNHAILGY